jgi:large subunit ribosomal protein L15
MNLHEINSGIKRFKKIKRRGRGIGSGHGKTSTRGHKGQFQGGSMPLVRRIPKRGFNNKFALIVGEINVGRLEACFEAGATVTPATLKEQSVLKHPYKILKILGNGEITKPLKVSAHRFSQSAKEKIEKAGGQVILLPNKKPVIKNKMRPVKKKPAAAARK